MFFQLLIYLGIAVIGVIVVYKHVVKPFLLDAGVDVKNIKTKHTKQLDKVMKEHEKVETSAEAVEESLEMVKEIKDLSKKIEKTEEKIKKIA